MEAGNPKNFIPNISGLTSNHFTYYQWIMDKLREYTILNH